MPCGAKRRGHGDASRPRGLTRGRILGFLRASDGRGTFAQVKTCLNLTDGNVTQHAKRLKTLGLITIKRTIQGNYSRTEYALTESGRTAK